MLQLAVVNGLNDYKYYSIFSGKKKLESKILFDNNYHILTQNTEKLCYQIINT